MFESPELAPAYLFSCLLAFGRVFTVVMLVPFLGGRLVPLPIKAGVSIVLVAVISPSLAPIASVSDYSSVDISALLIKEAAIGALIGVLTALVFHGAAMAGAIIDGARTGDPDGSPRSPDTARAMGFADLYSLLTVVIFLALGGHRLLVHSLHRSFQLLPPHELPTGLVDVGFFITVTGNLFLVALAVALPVLAALFIVDIGLAAASRFVRPVHAFALGVPLKVLVVVMVATVSIAAAIDLLMAGTVHVDRSLQDILEQVGRGG